MARVKNLDQIAGNVGKLSFYTRKGSSGIFVRTKGGASKEKIKRDPALASVRKSNKEFGGCSKMSKQIRMTFFGLEHVAEFNISSALNSLAKSIQKTDTINPVGERAIRLSEYRYLLAGFDFSRSTRFSSLLRVPLSCHVARESQQASVKLPAFDCSFGLNLYNIPYRQFRLTAALGIATDMALNPSNQTYEPVHDKLSHGYQSRSTPWHSTRGSVQASEISLSLMDDADDEATPTILTEADSLVLTVILEFGEPDALGNITPVRGAGGGMIVCCE